MSTHPVRVPAGWRTLLWLEPFWLAALSPSILFPGRFWVIDMQPLLVALLFLFWPLRWIVSGALVRRSPLTLAIGGLVGVVLVSLGMAHATASGWSAAGVTLLGITLFFALIDWPPVRRYPTMIAWVVIGLSVLLACCAPLLIVPNTVASWARTLPLAWGALADAAIEDANPNVLAGALVVIFPLAVAASAAPARALIATERFLLLLAVLSIGAALLLLNSRGALAATAVAVWVMAMMRWQRARWLAVLSGIGGLWLVWALATSTIALDALVDQIAPPDARDAKNMLSLDGIEVRVALWQQAVQLIELRPHSGVGQGLYPVMAGRLAPTFIAHGRQPEHAHNLLLQIGAELGVWGLTAFLGIVLVAAAMLGNIVRRRPVSHRRRRSGVDRQGVRWVLGIGAAGALAALLVHGIVDAALWGTKVAPIFWLWLSVVTVLFLDPPRHNLESVGGVNDRG